MKQYTLFSVTIATFFLLMIGVEGTVHAQTVEIDNGVFGPGHLAVNIDSYGAYGNFNAAYVDDFEPPTGGAQSPTFTAGFRLFSGLDRVVLTDMPDWTNILTNETWSKAIISQVALSGTDAATSSFEVLDGAGLPVLNFELTQTVSAPAAGIAFLDQVYLISNIGGSSLDFTMNRVLDADLVWDLDFENDHVAVSDPLGFVSQHEPSSDTQAMALTAPAGGIPFTYYWAGKNTHEPTGGTPAFGFGTDTVVWTNMGLPETWRNYVSHSGYDTAGGDSGLVTGQDGHIGLDWELSLAKGESVTLKVRTIYGSQAFCVTGDINGDGKVTLLDVSPFVDLISSGGYLCEADFTEDGAITLLDVGPFVDAISGGP